MLLCEPRVLIADEPTRGVDVGAKRAIYDFLVVAGRRRARRRRSSRPSSRRSSASSHRVLVMRRGRIVAELEGDEMTEAAILAAAFGDDRASGTSA